MTKSSRPYGALGRRFGPTALITGASDGIGRAFATQLAEQGFDLILVARREATLRDLATDLVGRFDVGVQVLAMDLTDPGSVAALMTRTEGTPVGLVVAAAGFGSIGPLLERDIASELEMVDLNCRDLTPVAHPVATGIAC